MSVTGKGDDMKIIDQKNEKLLNSIIFFCENTKFCGLTKLNKLLYFLDFFHYNETGKSVTGQDYFAWEFGPVPVDVYKEITGEEDKKLALKNTVSVQVCSNGFKKICIDKSSKFDEDAFSNRELKLLYSVAKKFKNAKADKMVEVSHLENRPWDITLKERGEWTKIEYDLVFHSEEDTDRVKAIREMQKERADMKRFI